VLATRQLRRTLLPALCAAALALLVAPHANAAPARTTFDHLTTGFELIGQHRDLPCESCHVNAIFKGTPRDCSACHGVGTAVHATSKPASHILASDRCDACHSPIAWNPATTFDHTEARGSCSTCHNNVQAQGKGATHIDTDLECDACHSTIGWAGAVFNHAGVTSGCASCHDGVHATGKPANHIPTDLPCESCHTSTTTWAGALSMPPNHIPTTAPCQQCHTTASNFALFSVTGVHQGVTQCLSCHGPSVAGTFDNVTIKTLDSNHFPIGSLDCNGAGCHSITNVNPGGFLIGAASITSPTLSVVGHTTIAGAVAACSTCHETAPYLGMVPGGGTASDARPSAALDKTHPTSGDCGGCHTTTPTFALDVTGAGLPANHIPTSAPCAQCHTTAGNYALYSVTGTHQGVTACLSCHGPSVASTFLNVTITTTPGGHIPIGNLDCNGGGCHAASNVNPGGFVIGTASITSPTLDVNGHASVATAVAACQTCHESAPYLGMLASSATAAGDSRPMAFDKNHPASGDCSTCHTTTPTFALDITAGAKPANHIPTSAPCAQCHTTAGNYALYSVSATHQGVTTCSNCHGPSVANTFANITITTTSASHIPIGSLDCNGGGCHTASNVNPGGFNLGAASITAPTLNTTGHTTVASAVAACQTCHESAPYQGMIASSASTAGDSRPPSALDSAHPTSGDCGGCHLTTPTFASDVVAGTKPANHIPTTAACTQCHQSPGNFAAYSVTGTHQGVTTCSNCHGPSVANTFANITITTTSASHIPIGSVDCNGGGCHTASNVNPGGFNIGAASITAPTLNTTGHTTVASAVAACQTCHESAPYQGMIASSASTAGDSRPTALDKNHPTSGDCGSCHTTTPTFATDETASATKPANHIPTSAACAQCHTTAGNYTLYSVTGTHQGVTTCANCHGSSVASTFANITITTTPASHIPFGSVDCNGSGCHTAANVNPGGFLIGAANINSPTLNTAGHTTVASAVSACQTCHESAGYLGMIASTATAGEDSRPTAFDKSHPTTGDCGACHTTSPTFIGNVTAGSKPSNHIPTNAPCAQCHTTAGNYAAYVMGTTGHTGITSGCATCHADGLSFANMAPPTLVEPPTGPTGHVPVGTVACELCHSITNFTTFAGTVMKHAAVRGNACDSCHEYGMKWKTNTGVQLWVRDGPNHHAGQDCGGSGCHTSRDKHASRPVRALPAAKTMGGGSSGSAAAASVAGAAVVARPALTSGGPTRPGVPGHPSVLGAPCVSCHGPASGMGKPSTHIATSNACQACHSTLAWMPVTSVDHTQVNGTCFSCHNGTLAVGKPATHIASSTACETCHTTNAWTQVRVDHAAVGRSCRNCHDGVHAAGLPVKHVPTRESCDACHGTLSWLPAKLDHSTLTAACATCHNGTIATGVLSSHLRTRLDCASCHTYPDWSMLVFKHTSAAYPGQHRAALDCAACHTSNTDQVPYPSAANAGTCAGCHAKDFKPAAHPATVKGLSYSAGELANCTGACHVYSDATHTTIVKRLPGPYHRVSDAQFKH
jgi:hypothetical protein